MARIRIHHEADCKLISARDFLIERDGSDAALKEFSEEALNTRLRVYEAGSNSSPQLFESQVLPDTVAAVHCHDEDEIMYILEGEMILGARSLKKGSAMFIQAKTHYGFRAGPGGVRFLNFRPRKC